MKYLKGYNENIESSEVEIIQSCRDILLELEDEGFSININSYIKNIPSNKSNQNPSDWIHFTLSKKSKFDYSDIEDVVERLKSYLSEYNLHLDVNDKTTDLSDHSVSVRQAPSDKPRIKTVRIMNPMTFTSQDVRTECKFIFNEKSY